MRETKEEVFPRETAAKSRERDAVHTFVVDKAAIDPAVVDRHVVSITDPFSPAAEQYKRLKARVISATSKDCKNTIMVTSADMSEGKTLTAINLAVTLAKEIDYTVLLVDADLRHPSIPKYLGIEANKGLSNYLKGEAPISDLLVKTGIGKLMFLPAGEVQQDATELLSSEKMRMLVHELKARYKDRYVIFDSSPLLVTADPISLGRSMDSVLLVVQEGRTSQEDVMRALSLTKGWNILGTVFNNVPVVRIKSRYSYYYRDGNKVEKKISQSGKDGTVAIG